MKKNIYFVTLILLLCACSKTPEDVLVEFMKEKTQVKDLNKIKACIVLPNAGCDGCISGAERFIIKNLEKFSEDLAVVLINYQSKKMLKSRMGENIYTHKHFLLDEERTLYHASVADIYPVVYYLEKGSIKNKQVASPENPLNVWEDLKEKLTK